MNETTTDAAAIFAPLWKRKWLILAVGILVAGATYAYYKNKPSVYTASTQLYLGGDAEAQSALAGTSGKSTLSGRALADQVGLINSPVIGEGVRKQLRKEGDLAAARGKAKAASTATSDFITISTEANRPRGAINLANAYARAYINRERSSYVRAVDAAIANTRQQLRRLETSQSAPTPTTTKSPSGAKGNTAAKAPATLSGSATIQAASLASKLNQLESQLSVSGVQQVGTAKASPLPVSPTPKKNAIFGFVLGLVLASIAAYILSRFDRRVRSLDDVEHIFGTQILTMLPVVRKPVIHEDGRPRPSDPLVEPIRRLHATLALGDMLEHDREHSPRVILVLSADAGDGRSALIADLALVQRDAGERVAVIEADFRRPVQAKLLDVTSPAGLGQVLTGALPLDDAMQRVASVNAGVSVNAAAPGAEVATAVQSPSQGSISVLTSGEAVANPSALLASRTMAGLLGSIAEDFDHVLIDAPPPLEVSDVMPLLHSVDGIVIVVRLGHTRETSAQRLAELLGRTSSAPVLGVVANHVPRADIERYGYSSTPGRKRRRRNAG
jgi:Mrp family chromosome partitioning ATPase/capsular polysaccharide biosynthesis protein